MSPSSPRAVAKRDLARAYEEIGAELFGQRAYSDWAAERGATPLSSVLKLFEHSFQLARLAAGLPQRGPAPSSSVAEAVRHLRRALRREGHRGRLTMAAYERYRADQEDAPGVSVLRRIFGSWADAVSEAGGSPGRVAVRDYDSPEAREAMLANLYATAAAVPEPLTARAYARHKPVASADVSQLARAFGSFSAAVEAAERRSRTRLTL